MATNANTRADRTGAAQDLNVGNGITTEGLNVRGAEDAAQPVQTQPQNDGTAQYGNEDQPAISSDTRKRIAKDNRKTFKDRSGEEYTVLHSSPRDNISILRDSKGNFHQGDLEGTVRYAAPDAQSGMTWHDVFKHNPEIDGKPFSDWLDEEDQERFFNEIATEEARTNRTNRAKPTVESVVDSVLPPVAAPPKNAAVPNPQQKTDETKKEMPPAEISGPVLETPENEERRAVGEKVDSKTTVFDDIKSFFYNLQRQREAKAKRNNEEFYREKARYGAPLSDRKLDAEEFYEGLGSLEDEHKRTIKSKPGSASTGLGEEVKNKERQWKLIDRVYRSLKIGFFPVRSQELQTVKVYDSDTGEWLYDKQVMRWSKTVENAMVDLMDVCGLDDYEDLDNQRTIFRLVMLYASMGVDRNGRMFNENSNEWSLTDQEFAMICNLIKRSIIQYGHPMAMPFRTTGNPYKLRGTDIYPSGVMPKVVAQAITGPKSLIKVDAGTLVDMCMEEWVTKTYPYMKANLTSSGKTKQKKNKQTGEVETIVTERNQIAQRIAIEDMQQAIARLDGINAETFSKRYGIDTTEHYKLSEYLDTNAVYAEATNSNYDSEKVAEIQLAKFEKEKERKSAKGSRSIGGFRAGLNMTVALAKSNALFLQVPIAVSAIIEHGVGDVQTKMVIAGLKRTLGAETAEEVYSVSDDLIKAMQGREAVEAIDAAYILMEMEGPVALQLYLSEGGKLNHTDVINYLNDKYRPTPGTKTAERIIDAQQKLDQITQKVLIGNFAFRKMDMMNWLNFMLVANQSIANAQDRLAFRGETDTEAGIALTGKEIDDIFQANTTITDFISEMMKTKAGKDALIAMRQNDIANFNPVSYKVGQFMRNHEVTNAALTFFVDTFVKYGINFIYAITPFARTITYLEAKGLQAKGNLAAGDFAIGGSIGESGKVFSEAYKEKRAEGKGELASAAEVLKDENQALFDEAFFEGLRMNLMFDALMFGRNLVVGGILGVAMLVLGFDEPDDPEDIYNISKWKIGKNIGLGEDGNGVEIQWAFWMNDLTQLGLPIAYLLATGVASGGNQVTMLRCFLDSIKDQVDGNVLLDIVDDVKNVKEYFNEMQRAAEDPAYQMDEWNDNNAILAIKAYLLSAFNKLTPGAPITRTIANSSFFQGENARARDPYKVYDKSSEWAEEVGKTNYVTDPEERLMRKSSMYNWILAGVNNLLYGDDKSTGYFWTQMPPKTKSDQASLVWANMFSMDYDNMGDSVDRAHYEADKAALLESVIEQFDGDPNKAMRMGFFIPHDIRMAALRNAYAEINALENEYLARKAAGELSNFDDSYAAYQAKKQRQSEIYDYIDLWLKNDDIPEWNEGYEQLLSDWDITYVFPDGSPASYIDSIFGDAVPEFKLKGNHPTSFLPLTVVDTRDTEEVKRGWSGETVPFWYDEKSTDLDAIMNGIGKMTVPVGQDAGEVLNDVLFGEEYDGQRLHPEEPTIDARAWVPKKGYLSSDVAKYDGSDLTADNTIYGAQAVKPSDNDNSAGSNSSYPTYYPKSSYGYSSSAGGGNYSPKIYSNPRSLNAPKAATMYTKQPYNTNTSYLRPSVSTKGSREASKRQDF